MDGTLLTNDKTLTPAAIDAIGELRNVDVALTIVSSRPPRGMRMLIEPMGLNCAMAGLNGGIYFNADLSIIPATSLSLRCSKGRRLDSERGTRTYGYSPSASGWSKTARLHMSRVRYGY